MTKASCYISSMLMPIMLVGFKFNISNKMAYKFLFSFLRINDAKMRKTCLRWFLHVQRRVINKPVRMSDLI